MNVSVGGILIGLLVGGGMGYGVAQLMSRDSNATSTVARENLAGSKKSANVEISAPERQGESVALARDIATPKSTEQQTNNLSAPSGVIDLNLEALKNHYSRSGGFSTELALMNAIADANFDQLETLALGLIGQQPTMMPESNNTLSLIGMRMIEIDADRTLAFIQSSLPTQSRGDGVYGMAEIIAILAKTHHEELLAWAASITNMGNRYQIQGMVFGGLSLSDPVAALALHEQYKPADGGMSLYPILESWARTDPQAAMDWASNQSTSQPDMGFQEMIFTRWLEKDSAAADAYLANVADPDFKAQLETQALMALASRDPQLALERVMATDNLSARAMTIDTAMYSWSEHSLEDAIAYATYSLSGAEQEQAFQALGNSAGMYGASQFGESPMDVMLSSDSLPDGLRESVRQNTMHAFFMQDPDGALQWLDTVSDPAERSRLIGSFAWELPQHDLTLAQSLYHQADEQTRSMLAPGIAMKLYENDPAAAWSWQQQISDEPMREEVFMSLLFSEAQTNPDEAMRLAMNAPSGQNGHMVLSIFSSIVYEHPEWATQWLAQSNLDDQTRIQLQSMLDESLNYQQDRYQTQFSIERTLTPYSIEMPYIEGR